MPKVHAVKIITEVNGLGEWRAFSKSHTVVGFGKTETDALADFKKEFLHQSWRTSNKPHLWEPTTS